MTSAFDLKDIPQEHVPLLLNSVICEHLFGFKRALISDTEGTRFTWTGNPGDGSPPETELFDFANDDAIALEMLRRFCDSNESGFQVNRIPKLERFGTQAHFRAFLLRADASGGATPVADVTSNRLSVAISLLVASQLPVSLAQVHRELFPGFYLLKN